MRITGLSVSLAIALVTACAPAHLVTRPAPTPPPGSRIRYAARSDSTELIAARLVSLDADSLVFERFIAGPPRGGWVAGSLATDSVARLQVRIGRRSNPGRGALFGAAVGLGLGIACAGEEGEWVTPEQCLFGYTLIGTGTGLVIGLLVRGDVWAPTVLPGHDRNPPVAGRATPLGFGLRLPIGLAGS